MVTNTDGGRPQTKAPPTRPPGQWPPLADPRVSQRCHAVLVSPHRSDVVGCAQPIPSVLASDATPRCASMASADRQMIGDATLVHCTIDTTPHLWLHSTHGTNES